MKSLFKLEVDPNCWIVNAPLAWIAFTLYQSLLIRKKDGALKKQYKEGWKSILKPIIDCLNKIYVTNLPKNDADKEFFDSVFFDKFTNGGKKMTLMKASQVDFYGLATTFIRSIRLTERFIRNGGKSRRFWEYQMEFADGFYELVSMLGEFKLENIELIDYKTGKQFVKIIQKEPLVAKLHDVVKTIKEDNGISTDKPTENPTKKSIKKTEKSKTIDKPTEKSKSTEKTTEKQLEKDVNLVEEVGLELSIETDDDDSDNDSLGLISEHEQNSDIKSVPEGALLAGDKVLLPVKSSDGNVVYVEWTQ